MSQTPPQPPGDRRVAIGAPEPHDEAALVGLWVASWQEAMPAIDFEARRGFIADALREPRHVVLVARLGGDPVGFAIVEAGHLHQLVVASATKGSGAAVALLDAVKARAPDGLTLDVNEINARAVRFYEREGFFRVGSGMNPASGLATLALRWTGP